jgi:hypothetical protein
MERRPQPGEIPAPPLPEPDDGLHVIHYSKERAEECTVETPALSALVVEHFLTGRQSTFAAIQFAENLGIPPPEFLDHLRDLERRLLEAFIAFAAVRPGATWLHWGMRGAGYGIEVIRQRAGRYGLSPPGIPPEREFDLALYLKRTYGDDYAPHPRFWHASHRNGVASPRMLTEEQATVAWDKGHYATLPISLSDKVHAIVGLYERARAGTFRTGGVEPTPPGPSAPTDSSRSPTPEEAQPAGTGSPIPSVAEIAEALRRAGRRGKALPAALVEFMAERPSAPVEEVAERVHGHAGTDCRRVQANVSRTNRELERLAAPFRFRVAASYVHKEPVGS